MTGTRQRPEAARSVALTEAGVAAVARALDPARLPKHRDMRIEIALTPLGLAAIGAEPAPDQQQEGTA